MTPSTPAFAPARAHGRHLFAANDPLSPADRALAATFAGSLDFPLTDTVLIHGAVCDVTRTDRGFNVRHPDGRILAAAERTRLLAVARAAVAVGGRS